MRSAPDPRLPVRSSSYAIDPSESGMRSQYSKPTYTPPTANTESTRPSCSVRNEPQKEIIFRVLVQVVLILNLQNTFASMTYVYTMIRAMIGKERNHF